MNDENEGKNSEEFIACKIIKKNLNIKKCFRFARTECVC